jgi:hypothetical protein
MRSTTTTLSHFLLISSLLQVILAGEFDLMLYGDYLGQLVGQGAAKVDIHLSGTPSTVLVSSILMLH